jgi:glycosyl transferase family 25
VGFLSYKSARVRTIKSPGGGVRPLQIHLINLDRSPERLAQFTALNRHLQTVSRFSAVDGKHVNRGDLVQRGIIDPALDYTDGAVGSLLSHFALWELAITENQPITVCEDDAILNYSFEKDSASIINRLSPDWHMIFWGWNFDAFALFELLPGVSPFLAHFDQAQMRNGVDKFQSAIVSPRCFRLLAAFGIICYTISPSGAQTLLRLCTPVTNRPVPVPAVGRVYANKDLGIGVLEFLPKINAFASFPPIAISKNDHASSTLLTGQDRQPPGAPG